MVNIAKFYCSIKVIYLNNKNRRGPRTDPWGTSQFIAARPESQPFMDKYWPELHRLDLNQSFKLWKFYSDSILPTVSGFSKSTLNVFCNSTKTIQPIFLPSTTFLKSQLY